MDDSLEHATITVRIIKSFEYRTIRNHVFRDVDLTKVTPNDLLEMTRHVAQTDSGFRPYRNVSLDTLKIYAQPYGTKSQDLAINLGHEELVLSGSEPLNRLDVRNETEISCYNEELYREYEANPVQKW